MQHFTGHHQSYLQGVTEMLRRILFLLIIAGSSAIAPQQLLAAENMDVAEARVVRLIDAGLYDQAIAQAQQLCDLAVEQYGQNHRQYARALRTLGHAYYEAGQTDTATG